MRQTDWVRGPIDPKPDTCTEGLEVDAVGISGKVLRLTLGDLPFCLRREAHVLVSSRGDAMGWQKSAEGIVGRSTRLKARTC